ncbi:MAG: carboxypeptidase-like regulatory domain-containing protein [Gemmatimonadaceae bacterium]
MRCLLALILCLGLLARPRVAGAQVARGVVVEQVSNTPLAGVLMELVRADQDREVVGPVASALSDAEGSFALLASAPGRYRVVAKRIGVRRFTSAPFDLSVGESRTFQVVLEALDYRLPEVVVMANTLCTRNPADAARVTALWEEARTALSAAEISLRDRLFTAEVTRYVRQLDPKSRRVLNETRSEVRGVVASPFYSAPPESLSALGYWRPSPDGGDYYFGPDATVLLSDVFLGEHCFHPVNGKGSRSAMVGLAFTPVAGRPVPDVTGTLWLDERTFELRLVEFAYDRVREGVDSAAVGGEVHFARLPNGAWIVRRWFIRIPGLGRPAQPLSTRGDSPWVLVRPTMNRLSESGGLVTTDDLRPAVRLATVTGVLRDSSGKRPLAQALVGIAGTARRNTPDASGRFTIDSVVPGSRALVVTAPGYDSLGVAAAQVPLELTSGESRQVQVTASDTRVLTEQLCREAAPWGRGTLHVTVRDSASGAAATGMQGTVGWMSTIGREAGDSIPATTPGVAGATGSLVFCAVPSGRSLEVVIRRADGSTMPSLRVTIEAREVRHLEILLSPR